MIHRAAVNLLGYFFLCFSTLPEQLKQKKKSMKIKMSETFEKCR